jgi:hypothetical protein
MCISSKRKRSSRQHYRLLIFARSAIHLCLFVFFVFATSIFAEKDNSALAALAWRVQGRWQVDGKGAPISAGDAIQPGSLLQPGGSSLNHSITIFLSDGRNILYECFTAEECARGFRVPSLYRNPAPAAVDMLARIHAGLVRENNSPSIESEPLLPREEVLAVLGPGNRVSVGGLVADLSNGRYTYDVRPVDSGYPAQFHIAVEKKGPAIVFSLPGSGIYDLTIADDLNTQRIDLFVAAVKPENASLRKSFLEANALLKTWNREGFGWPIHDFQRAYLESLMQDSKQRTNGSPTVATGNLASNAGTTGERIAMV